MKRILMTAVALLAVGLVPAHAADIATYKKAPAAAAPVVAPAYNWSGWYVGGHAGWGSADFSGIFDNAGSGHLWSSNNNSGSVWGVQAGFNLQNGMWVWGAEADWSSARWDKSVVDTEDDTQAVRTRDLASIRGRLGVANNNWLFYGTAGWGWGKVRVGTELNEGAPNAAWRSMTAKGLVYGGGVEWAFAPSWTLRAEYLHYAFGDTLDYPNNIVNDADTGDFFRYDHADVFRVGLNYIFNWGRTPF